MKLRQEGRGDRSILEGNKMSEFGIKETKEWPLLSSHEVDKSMVEPAKAGE